MGREHYFEVPHSKMGMIVYENPCPPFLGEENMSFMLEKLKIISLVIVDRGSIFMSL